MLQRRRLLAAPIAALLLLCPPIATASDATATSSAAARKPPRVDQAQRARALARSIVAARSAGARRAALTSAFRTLHVGVYSGRGRALVRGTERSSRDVFLYEAELRALATALEAGTTLDLAQLGERLLALRLARRAPTAAQLERATRAARAARRDPAALGGLLIDALGREGRRRAGEYDALQVWLIEAELVARAAARRGARKASAAAPVATAAAAPECFSAKGALAKAIEAFGLWGMQIGVAPDPNPAYALWHASTLASLVKVAVRPSSGTSSTHFGPAGHAADAGRELTFSLVVTAPVGAGERELGCGVLHDAVLPRKGPLADIPVDWESVAPGAIAALRGHGQITRMDGRTNAAGTALLVFKPADEKIPGVGELRTSTGTVTAQVDVGGAFGNLVKEHSRYSEARPAFAFSVSYHQARGYRFLTRTDVLCFTFTVCQPHSYRNTFTYNAEMCGPDPYTGTWRGARTKYQETEGEPPEVTTYDLEFTLTRGGTARTFPPSREGRMDDRVEFTLLELSPPLMRVDSYYSNLATDPELYRTYEAHKAGAIEENPNCPPVP